MKKAGAGKLDQRQSKTESVDDAELNREEALKKIALGKITFEKSDEKQIFKRNKVAKKVSLLLFELNHGMTLCLFRSQIHMIYQTLEEMSQLRFDFNQG